ncbi:hypothetical protein A2856_01940 [Candidatus Uhrbacteria bacterium RIFCSPHIGHO2_01_FULL_63_20]|uniref:Glycerophosphoryl diester phosphodiesterase membrane domain-containing protein n=1 Tax=Candidatus Uhrbacteria bacterium RIFCSPHIGHO2_01_FULL_63_20 TaxID=1802385 RepID=A0A1F7TK87_9BACT|nr:MAG: hypothetical protein A2856_01940 [Candidatus Uhrbacteria bacterium RIFCSPHIGHO2_01_FULL_63_20]
MADTRLKPIGELLRASWALFSERFISLAALSFIGAVAGMLAAGAVLFAVGGSALLDQLTALQGNVGEIDLASPAIVVGVILSLLVGLLVSGWQYAAVGRAALATHPASFMDTGRAALKDALPMFVVLLLTFFAIMLGFAVFFFPGVYVLIAVAFVVQVALAEGKRGLSALRRSRDLVRGYWWAIFGRYLAIVALIVIARSILSTAFGAAGQDASDWFESLFDILVFFPFWICLDTVLYRELVAIKGK